MWFYRKNLMLTIVLIIFCGPFTTNSARSLQIFKGTVTEIICSADEAEAQPVFHLVTEEGVEYDAGYYSQLPSLFDIEAVVSPDGSNVTLLISGTNSSNGVTVVCRDLRYAVFGRIETLFTLVLEFFSTLPAPDNVHYTRQGQTRWLQMMWQPPTLFSTSQNVSVDSGITYYVVSITSEDTVNISHFEISETSLHLELDNESCTFSFQVAAVNPAGIGEHSHPQIINWCTSSTTQSTTVATSSPASRTKVLSDSEIAAIAICVAVPIIVVALLVATAFIYAKIKSNRSTQNLKSNLSHEVRCPKDILPEKEKEKDNTMEGEHSSSDIHDDDIVDGHQQEADAASTQRERCYSHDGPPDGLYYAEINVLTKKKNRVPEPSSEDIGHHVYAVLEKPAKNDADQNVEPDTDHPAADSRN